MCSPSPPPAPDYAAAAREQGTANLDTAVASSNLNNPNVYNPYGTQTYTPGATASDRPTLTQTFSPEQQRLYDQQVQLKGMLGGIGVQGAGKLGEVIGQNLDLSGAPKAPGSYEDTRKRVIDAAMSRADEDYGKQIDQSNSNLIDAGIRPGTKAYADARQMIERSRNDARQQAEITGGNAASQAFNLDTQRRKDSIAEILAQRQTPLNEVTALMSGSQVSNPFAIPGQTGTQVAAAPVFAAQNAAGQYSTDLYNADVGATNSQRNAAMSAASMYAMYAAAT